MVNKICNAIKLIYMVGWNYLAFLSTKNENDFNDYLLSKQNISFERFTYVWIYLNYKRKQDLSSLLNLWCLGKDHITFTKNLNEEKFHAAAFESAVSVRDFSMANKIFEYFNKDSNYLELANVLKYVFFNPDINIKNVLLADKPRPYYLHYLFPMCEGIIAESRNDLTNAQNKYDWR